MYHCVVAVTQCRICCSQPLCMRAYTGWDKREMFKVCKTIWGWNTNHPCVRRQEKCRIEQRLSSVFVYSSANSYELFVSGTTRLLEKTFLLSVKFIDVSGMVSPLVVTHRLKPIRHCIGVLPSAVIERAHHNGRKSRSPSLPPKTVTKHDSQRLP